MYDIKVCEKHIYQTYTQCTVMRPKNVSMHSAVNARVRANDKINILNDFRSWKKRRRRRRQQQLLLRQLSKAIVLLFNVNSKNIYCFGGKLYAKQNFVWTKSPNEASSHCECVCVCVRWHFFPRHSAVRCTLLCMVILCLIIQCWKYIPRVILIYRSCIVVNNSWIALSIPVKTICLLNNEREKKN